MHGSWSFSVARLIPFTSIERIPMRFLTKGRIVAGVVVFAFLTFSSSAQASCWLFGCQQQRCCYPPPPPVCCPAPVQPCCPTPNPCATGACTTGSCATGACGVTFYPTPDLRTAATPRRKNVARRSQKRSTAPTRRTVTASRKRPPATRSTSTAKRELRVIRDSSMSRLSRI
jgi:hypothetical protein